MMWRRQTETAIARTGVDGKGERGGAGIRSRMGIDGRRGSRRFCQRTLRHEAEGKDREDANGGC
jgi:hypothetical protein